ncbi:hypothetical protein BVY04_04815 [bacterium M21]|nr:hypothetical protein BVY04_04815 [bacterium M21]
MRSIQRKPVVLAGLFILLSVCCAYSQGVKLDADLLYPPVDNGRAIAPVILTMKTDGPFEGKVGVCSAWGKRTAVTYPVKVGKGTFRYELPYDCSNEYGTNRLTARVFTKEDRVVASAPVFVPQQMTSSASSLAVAWVKPGRPVRRRQYDWLGGKVNDFLSTEDSLAQRSQARTPGSGGIPRSISVHVYGIQHSNQPMDWRMYRGLDVIVIGHDGASRLTRDQVRALSQWVISGGVLLSAASAMQTKRNESFVAAFCADEEPELASVREHGLGKIVFSESELHPVDFAGVQLIPSHLKRELIKQQLIKQNLFAWTCNQYQSSSRFGFGGGWQSGIWEWTNLEQISKVVMTVFLGIFFVTVCILDRLVLRSIKRRHWTWFTIPILVAGFCYGANQISNISRGFRSRLTSLYVHSYGTSGKGTHLNYHCLAPSSSAVHRFRLGKSGYGQRQAAIVSRGNEGDTPAEMNLEDHTLSVANGAWTPAFFTTTMLHEESSPYTVIFKESGSSLCCTSVEVAHDTQGDIAIVYLDGNAYTGPLESGATWHIGKVDALPILKRLSPNVANHRFRRHYSPYYYDLSIFLQSAFPAIAREWTADQRLDLPQLDGTDKAWLIVFSEHGTGLTVEGRSPLTKSLHVYRQMVRIGSQGGGQ